jgi:GNAT superfamily N-acetyltransferase
MSDLEISTDRNRLDVDMIYGFLSKSYWATNRPRAIVQTSIDNSLCFGAYLDGKQVGFARVITDYAVFGYVADVFVHEPHRGKGIARQLLKAITGHPDIQGLRLVMLATRDAHGLYEQFGFELIPGSERVMTLFAIRDDQ